MSQSTYSWMGSQLHLVLEDDLANAYNRAQTKFFEAQERYMEEHGQKWTGRGPLWIDWTKKEKEAWDSIASLINLLVEINGGSLAIMEEDMTSDFLIKL